MSKAFEAGRLAVEVPAGVAYRIVNAAGEACGQGTTSWEFSLAPGIYAIEWYSGGARNETMVRVLSDETAHADYPLVGAAAANAAEPGISKAPDIVKALRPSEREYGSDIAVVVAALTGPESAQALAELRLFNTRDVAMRAAQGADVPLHLAPGESARRYNVRPGRYALSYVSHTGETVQQSVPALNGRTTIVFLEAVSGVVIVAKGSDLSNIRRSGIDPARTVMISVTGKETDPRIRERLRLTRLLLVDLAGGSAALTEDFCAILERRSVDPLLRLAGAMAVLARLEAAQPPSLELAIARNEPPDVIVRHQWMERAASWLARSNFSSLPTDVTAAWWQIEKMGKSKPEACPTILTAPPMYACGWRWATGASALRPQAIRDSAMTLAAARSSGDSGPWLCWRPRAATAQPEQRKEKDPRSNGELCNALRFEIAGHTDIGKMPYDLLGADDASIVRHIRQMSDRKNGDNLASELASALGLPGAALRRQLMRTLRAVETIGSKVEYRSSNPTPPSRRISSSLKYVSARPPVDNHLMPVLVPDNKSPSGRQSGLRRKAAPALSRRIANPDDPQRGRFGGQARRQGFELTARFESLKSGRWTNIQLDVTGRASDGTPVQFFLHDSFQPAMQEIVFKDGAARLRVTAWGGFTVGAWLPLEGIELELDLAALPDAPQTIRTR